MPPAYDCYIFADERTPALARRFLDEFLPRRKPVADEYEFPHHAQRPEIVFKTADELLEHLVTRPGESHQVYWRSLTDSLVRFAIVAPTCDGGMVLGLSLDDDNHDEARKACDALKAFAKTDEARLALESPPPTSKADFVKFGQRY